MGLWGSLLGLGASFIPGVGPFLGPAVAGLTSGLGKKKPAASNGSAYGGSGSFDPETGDWIDNGDWGNWGGDDSGGGGFDWQSLLKYGLPAAAGAGKALLDQRNTSNELDLRKQQLAQQKYGTQVNAAIDQSKLDPFRGVMSQAKDVGRLERMATPPQALGPGAGSPYAGYRGSFQPFTPSDTYRSSVQNAQSAVASGRGTMPNMLDEANWGKTGTMDLTQPNGGAPATPAPYTVMSQDPMAGTVFANGARIDPKTGRVIPPGPASFLSRYATG